MELLKCRRTFKVAMIFQLIILTTASLFSQVKCRTYIPEKYSLEHNPNNRQTYQPTYNPTEQQRRTVYVDKGQYPNGWNENIMRGDRSPIIFTDEAPIIINYNAGHSGPGQSPYGFRNSCPIVRTSQSKVTVNYDGPQDDDDVPPNNRDIRLFTKTMVELPSGIVMSYLKFKTISPYLTEDQKSDVRIILDNKNMTYEQFQETLRYYGCDDLEDSPQPSSVVDLTNYVTLANGTQVEMDDYRHIVSGITSGSETLMVPNVVSGKYSLYRSLIADVLPELIPSAFVITHAGDVVPFSLYHAVDMEHFQRPSTAVVPRIRQIKWRDGKLVDVQTIRHVIDALKKPEMISFVFPNQKRMPFVQCDVKESTELYNYDPEKVVVDVGQCKNILLSHFNDILLAMRIPDDSATGDGKYKRFNPPVFAWNPAKYMNTAPTNAQPDGKVCNKSNNDDNGNYSGYSIHVINKDKRRADDKPADKQLTVFGPVSAMEKTTCLDSNDTIRIILTSSSGTHEIKITNVLNNKKPLIYDITDKPVNVRDLKNIISQNECNYSPLLINKTNTTNVTNSMNPQNNNRTNIFKTNTENDCKPIIKNNKTNCMTDIKNTSDLKDPPYLNESTQNQTVTMCNKNSTTNNNKNQTTETVTTTMVTQNNTELTNTTTCNLNTSGKINNITIENGNNATKTPDCTEKYTKDQQNDCGPVVTGSNEIPITKNTDKNQTEITNRTQTNAENAVCANGTHTDTKSVPDNDKNNTITTESKNNTTISSPNNCQNSSNPVTVSTAVNDSNQNQTETKNTTLIPDCTIITNSSNTTNADKTHKPNKTNDNTVTTENRNNTNTDPKNNQNSSNPINESNTTAPIMKNDNNQTETNSTTTINNVPNVNANTTDSNNTNAVKKPAPEEAVTMETRNNTSTDPKNNQNSSNPISESNTTAPIMKNDNNQTETNSTTTINNAPNVNANTTDSNNTNAVKKPAPEEAVTMETRNNTNTDPKNNQNSSNPVIGGTTVPIKNGNNDQTETKDTTTTMSPSNVNANTTDSNNTNAVKKPAPEEAVTMETRNNTNTDPKNNQNSSNPISESNTTAPIMKNDNNQTETNNTTTINNAPNVNAITTDLNNTNAVKKPAPNHTDNDAVSTKIRNDTITDPNHTAVVTENPQNDSNPVVESDETPAITNTADYQNPAETVNTTVSTPNYVENTKASNSGRTDDDTYTGSNEAPGAVNSTETIQTPETAIASDADDVGPTENTDTISETNTGVNNDESTDVYNITTTGTAEPTQPTPIYTEIIKTPNNGSMTNNATKIVNIIVY